MSSRAPTARSVVVLAPPRFVAPLGVIRSLRPLGARVYCLGRHEPSIASASRWCAGKLRVGYDGRPVGASPEAIVEQLLNAGAGLGDVPLLLPASDEWAIFVAEHAAALRQRFVFPELPPELVRALASKTGMHELAQRHRVPTPRVLMPERLDDLDAMAGELGYPLLLKPLVSLPGREGVALVTRPDQLLAEFSAIGGLGTALLQEYVPGRDADTWMFNGYFDAGSRCLAGFTARKLRQYPPGMGLCSLGICERNDEVTELSCRFLSAVGYRGVVDIDFRRDSHDGTYKVLDVNPRLGGAFRLMVDRDGLDVARALYLDLTGRRVRAADPEVGRKWLLEAADLIALRHYRRDRRLTFRSWLRSALSVQEAATLALVDPVPFLVSMRIVLAETLNGRWQRSTARLQQGLTRLLAGRPWLRSQTPCRSKRL